MTGMCARLCVCVHAAGFAGLTGLQCRAVCLSLGDGGKNEREALKDE